MEFTIACHGCRDAEGCMADLVFVVLTVAFFAISIAYVRFCDWVK
jgi:hypothetical protein